MYNVFLFLSIVTDQQNSTSIESFVSPAPQLGFPHLQMAQTDFPFSYGSGLYKGMVLPLCHFSWENAG